jgi:cytochrome P450
LILPLSNGEIKKKMESLRNKIGSENSHVFFTKMSDANFSEEEIIDNIVTLLFAGYETTAYSLSRAIYELGKNVDKQQELRKSPELINPFIKHVLFNHPAGDITPVGNQTISEINVGDFTIPKTFIV